MNGAEWSLREAALTIPCGWCGAQPGEKCQSSSGRATGPHAARCWPLSTAFAAGYDDGLAIAERRAATS